MEFVDNILNNVPKCLQKELGEDYSLNDNQKIKYDYKTFEGELCHKLGISYTHDSQNENLPRFSMPFVIDDLVARDEKVDELCDKILNNHIYNLVGIGGIGKTTLSYLLTKKYSPLFSNIAYVVVNGNIKEDFASQINATLNLDIAPNVPTDEKYKMVISVMDQYQSENNLLILDVNETADKAAIVDYAKKLKNNTLPTNKIYPNNWNILILSREKFGHFRYEDLSDDKDKAFLKELFLKSSNKNENAFKDYAGLFELIKYSPLLAEQLGIYFENQPMPSLEEIKGILYGNLREEEILGTNAHNRDERTLISFLKNLIHYQDFMQDEQNVLRHFVLWKSDYFGINIIGDLIKDVCQNLNNALGNLANRTILSFDETNSSYKLHGLLADSIREQIDVTKQDYSQYINNIYYRITEYDFGEFLPFADCIGNSLCEYEITTRVVSLYGTAVKFYETWKTDYAKRLYEKCIEISGKKLEAEPEDIDCMKDLSYAYNGLASLLMLQLNDYKSTETNYLNAIEIAKRILQISDTLKYQNWLALCYNNLACLQDDYLKDPKSAEINYKEAIKIQEKITQQSDTPEYLNRLAMTYYNLADLQKKSLNDSAYAEVIYNRVIEIGEQIRKMDNPKSEYLFQLSCAYNNLANIQRQRKNFESSKMNVEESIKIRDSIKDENVAYLVGWMLSKRNLADILIATGNPDAARAILNEIKPIAEKWLEIIPNYGQLQKVNGWIKETESKLDF